MRELLARGCCLLVLIAVALVAEVTLAEAAAADGNRLAYLNESDPFYPNRDFPKLTTPQWIGEPGVEAVVILSIDDMRGHEKWEAFLRPLVERLKKIDGRAPVSIMTCQIDPRQPHLQTWLKEGLSLETHTYDHPCPLLNSKGFAEAKQTYDRCVDQMFAVPGNRPVAFRMPCCDSQNTASPRFFAEIFNSKTNAGNFLEIDSSVFNITTANDPALPRELVLDENAQEHFRKYLPFKSYVATIEDYPYPYVIGQKCREFPCAVPSDWSAQHVNKPDNPRTVEDLKRALDAAVIKQGVFTLVFHPHKWIKPEQLVELVDHAVSNHGSKVKFLNFHEALERISKNVGPLRLSSGTDAGVRLLDVNGDGYMDVLGEGDKKSLTKVWDPKSGAWRSVSTSGVHLGEFGVVQPNGAGSLLRGDGQMLHFVEGDWREDAGLTRSWDSLANEVRRLRDLDGDGTCELIVASAGAAGPSAVYRMVDGCWQKLAFALPSNVALADERNRDAGLRFVDIDQNETLDVLFSNEKGYAAYLFDTMKTGWTKQLVAGKPDDPGAIPMFSRDGQNAGTWIHSRTIWSQNESTDKLPDLVARKSLDDLLVSVPFPGPKSPQQSLAVMHARAGFQVELMASEPLVRDPIAMAWGPDGKLWVVEMGDYPRGVDGQGGHGGTVRCLEDTDDDGRYDKSTLFLDDLGYPNGITPWRGGVLVTCAPDILYAEDTDGDGKADKREVLYHGFLQGNPQHRMNGLKWGMDGWLYGAHGDATGGKVKLVKRDEYVGANNRDFRIRPDEGLLDPQSGSSQYGRSPDDWGNWFGNQNSEPMYQFVLADHYLRRNPHVPAANGRDIVFEQSGAAEVFPRSRTVARFNDLYAANRFTSANSTIVYRDDLLGPAFEGNAFVSEPVHNLVHREVMIPEGLTFRGRRAADEQTSEFLASNDNWFRPTSLATGPDGALWIADMYRQTIEHPEWIPINVQKQIDLRAGSDMGRIYRVFPIGKQPRKIPRLDKLTLAQLVDALDTPSGWQRDMVEQMLVWKADKAAVPPLVRLSVTSSRPATRAQALWTAELLGGLVPGHLVRALKDKHPGVRRQAIEIAEKHLAESPSIGEAIVALADDADLPVQLQRAYALGEWQDTRAGRALGEAALKFVDDPFLMAAVFSSVTKNNLKEVAGRVLDVRPPQEPPAQLIEQLVALSSAYDDEATLRLALERIAAPSDGKYAAWQLTALAGLLEALDRRNTSWEKYDANKALAKMFAVARSTVSDASAPEDQRLLAIRLLGSDVAARQADIESLAALLTLNTSGELQAGAVQALSRIDSDAVPPALLAGWKAHGPELRSQVLDVLLGRPAWATVLLTAIEEKRVPAADIDATRRQRLTKSDDAAIKERAEKLLAGAIASDRKQVVDEHAGVLELTGDLQAGAATFAKRCGVCHRLRGVGHDVGPNLASLTDYSPQTLLIAMLDPNRAVEAKYLDYLAITTSGVTHTGMLANETGNSVTLQGQEAKQQTILRSELEALQATGKSLMPEGLEKDLRPQGLADLIAYMRGSGAPRKVFPANHPHLVLPTTEGALQLYPTSCEIYGSTILMEHLFKNLGRWQSENDRAVWNVELPKPGRFSVTLNYACLDKNAGNSWLLEAGDKKLTGKVAATGSLDRYVEVGCGEIDLPAGNQQIVFRSEGKPNGNLLNLGGVLLKPVKAK